MNRRPLLDARVAGRRGRHRLVGVDSIADAPRAAGRPARARITCCSDFEARRARQAGPGIVHAARRRSWSATRATSTMTHRHAASSTSPSRPRKARPDARSRWEVRATDGLGERRTATSCACTGGVDRADRAASATRRVTIDHRATERLPRAQPRAPRPATVTVTQPGSILRGQGMRRCSTASASGSRRTSRSAMSRPAEVARPLALLLAGLSVLRVRRRRRGAHVRPQPADGRRSRTAATARSTDDGPCILTGDVHITQGTLVVARRPRRRSTAPAATSAASCSTGAPGAAEAGDRRRRADQRARRPTSTTTWPPTRSSSPATR